MSDSGAAAATSSIFAATSRRAGPPSRLHRLAWLALLMAMWAFLAYPVSDLLSGPRPAVTRAAALAALAAFALLWLRTMWLSLALDARTRPGDARTRPGDARTRPAQGWFLATAAVGVPLAFAAGTAGFDAVFIYLGIAAAVSLALPATIPAIAGCTGAAWILLQRVPGGVSTGVMIGQLSFVFWLGAMMLFYRRMMLLVIELRQAREELARMAVTEERLRIARELHDLLGRSLSTISLKAQLARRLAVADPVVATELDNELATELADIESVTADALVEVREAVTGYRQTTLATELDHARVALAAAGIDVRVELGAAGLPARTDALLGWVVREAVTNVVRHSSARCCTIALNRRYNRHQQGSVMLEICDDGAVAAGEGAVHGNGLTGLAERIEAAGGVLRAGPRGERPGFRLSALLPLGGPPS